MRTLIILLFPLLLTAQDIEVYEYNQYGVRDLLPKKEIEKTENGDYLLFNVDEYGIRDIQAEGLLQRREEENTVNYDLYDIDNFGVQDFTPSKTIEIPKNTFSEFEQFNLNMFKTSKN